MIDIKDLEKLAKQKEDENFRFRQYLKRRADVDELDRQFKQLHEKYFKLYDCKKCRNCCKLLGMSATKKELDKICKSLNLDEDKFIKEELIEEYGTYFFKEPRCKFLDEDNNCQNEKNIPKSCKEYPNTNKPDRLFSLYNIINNASVCPVVYEILEELKQEYNFK